MRILQIHNKYIYAGGEDSVVEEEAELLISKGHEIIQLFKDNSKINSLYQKIDILINLPYSNNSKKILIDKLNEIEKPDIVHIHNLFPLWTYSILEVLKEKNIPVVMTLHNYRLLWNNLGLFDKEAKKYGYFKNSRIKTFFISRWFSKYRRLLNRVDKFIVLTDFMKETFENAGFSKTKLIVKPNFIKKKNVILKEINNKNDAIFASRISREKGIFTLLKAWSNLNLNLKIYGDGPDSKSIIQKNKNTNIFFNGQISRDSLMKEISYSKFLIFPSEWFECLPMTIIEAFRESTLVLASDIGSIKSIIKHKFNGILFKPGDDDDLKKKVEWILNNPKDCDNIVKNALNQFNELYTDEINYKYLVKLYNDVIESHKQRL